MSKFPTFPTLYDEVLQISISKLKEWGYLKAGQIKSGTISWSRNGNPTGSISIHANMQTPQPYIELDYKYKDEPRKYRVYLVFIPANIGNGTICYFLCPHTNKRCRKLYSIGGYFLHREAFKGCMYDCQTQSKRNRLIIKKFKPYWKDHESDQLHAKHFRAFYNGKPTKKYLRINKRINEANSIPYHEIERALLS